MKEVKRITGLIEKKRTTIDRLQSDQAQAYNTAAGAGQFDEKLEELQLERRDILAKAYIDGKPANTKSIDLKIEAISGQASAARESAAAAKDANAIISRGIALEKAELDELEQQLKTEIRSAILARHDGAAAKYADAITQLGSIVAEMTATERAWKHVVTHLMNDRGSDAKFPRRGLRILDDIRSTGVRVPSSASRLQDPSVAAEYGPHFDDFWYLPKWADPRTLGFADEQVAEIVGDLANAGVDVTPFVQYTPPVPQTQLKVRVRRGVIQGSPKILRDPESGNVVSSEVVEFGLGDDVLLDESQARGLKRAGMVLIHGEDDLISASLRPTRNNTVDASLSSDERHRHGWVPTPHKEYSGHRHSIDLTPYRD